jgi:hypothetical protein
MSFVAVLWSSPSSVKRAVPELTGAVAAPSSNAI